jgi:hypothetical protein
MLEPDDPTEAAPGPRVGQFCPNNVRAIERPRSAKFPPVGCLEPHLTLENKAFAPAIVPKCSFRFDVIGRPCILRAAEATTRAVRGEIYWCGSSPIQGREWKQPV